jgi:D-alanyl-D-alanine carboxypeptidase (penicillin-binding protein 5/6)
MNRGRGKRAAVVAVLLAGCLVVLSACGGGDEARQQAAAAPAEVSKPVFWFSADKVSLQPPRCASAVLLEAGSGTVLYSWNEHQGRAPASIVKTMLELVVLDEVDAGRLSFQDSVRVSKWASRMGGSQVFLKEGEVFTLEELLHAVVISSANDACVAIAEHIAGSPDGFVEMMNARAEKMGLKDTNFVNVHGLDDEPGDGNITSAYDVAQIARELVRHEHVLSWSSTVEAPFRNGTFRLINTNKMLGDFQGMDGLKTGFTNRAGFCLAASAQRRGLRFISVVLGAETSRIRFQETARLLSAGFNGVTRVSATKKDGDLGIEALVLRSHGKRIRPQAGQDVTVFVPRSKQDLVHKEVRLDKKITAPLKVGQKVGVIEVRLGDQMVASVPALSNEAVEAKGWRAWLKRKFGGA